MEFWQAVVATSVGVVLANLFAFLQDRWRSKREVAQVKDQREHDRLERRYDGRLSAYTAFFAEADSLTTAIDSFEAEKGAAPGAAYDESDALDALRLAWGRVNLIGSPHTRKAAEIYYGLITLRYRGLVTKKYANLSHAQKAFETAARVDLGISTAPVMTPETRQRLIGDGEQHL